MRRESFLRIMMATGAATFIFLAFVPCIALAQAEGSTIKTNGRPEVYLIQEGQRRQFPDSPTVDAHIGDVQVHTVSQQDVDAFHLDDVLLPRGATKAESAQVNATCTTGCSNSNTRCMAGSCRCSAGGNGFCAPPYPAPYLPGKPMPPCTAPNHVQDCGGNRLCCGAGFGACVDGNHPMCVK